MWCVLREGAGSLSLSEKDVVCVCVCVCVCVYARGEERRGEGYRCDKLIVLVCWGKHSHNADCKNHEESPLLVAQNTLVTPILCVNCM